MFLKATMPSPLTPFFLTILLLSCSAQAQNPSVPTLPEKPDVRIIVDISGSMKDNDPENLRQPAVRLLARLVPEGASAGLWTFGQYVNMLVPHREVGGEWRDSAIEKSRQINSVALRTNLGKAIEVAGDGYYTGGDFENTHFILLTDGKVDISSEATVNQREENRILDTIVADLVEQGATFHPIALSEEADAAFLEQLARKSGGRFQVAANAEALNRAFLEALNAAAPQEQIPIEGNTFSVDQGVTEFTALVFWGEQETRATRELELVRPDGSTVSLTSQPENIRWAREAGYDLMTASEPMAGDWRINGELGEGSRVTVVSDLRMVVSSIPPTFSEKAPIDLDIAFFEEGERIENPDFLQVLDVRLRITSEDGRSGTKVLSGEQAPGDGIYTDTIARLPVGGLYEIEVVADGQTFGRKFSTRTEFIARDLNANDQPSAEVSESADSPKTEVAAPEVAEPESAMPGPIDVSKVEEPVQAVADASDKGAEQNSQKEEVSALPAPLWMLGAGVGGLALITVLWFAFRQHQARRSAQTAAAAERETVADLESEEPEPVAEPGPVAADVPEPSDEAEEPNPSDESLKRPDDEASEEIPELAKEVAPAEDMSELESVIDEEDDEEFGLDDFDLSEFDNLPEQDEAEADRSDDDAGQAPEDEEPKK